MSEPKWVICKCNLCSGEIEFDAEHANETVGCPHCKAETVLFLPYMRKPVSVAPPTPPVSIPTPVKQQPQPADNPLVSQLEGIGRVFYRLGLAGGLLGILRLVFSATDGEDAVIFWVAVILICGVIGTALNAVFKFMAENVRQKSARN